MAGAQARVRTVESKRYRPTPYRSVGWPRSDVTGTGPGPPCAKSPIAAATPARSATIQPSTTASRLGVTGVERPGLVLLVPVVVTAVMVRLIHLHLPGSPPGRTPGRGGSPRLAPKVRPGDLGPWGRAAPLLTVALVSVPVGATAPGRSRRRGGRHGEGRLAGPDRRHARGSHRRPAESSRSRGRPRRSGRLLRLRRSTGQPDLSRRRRDVRHVRGLGSRLVRPRDLALLGRAAPDVLHRPAHRLRGDDGRPRLRGRPQRRARDGEHPRDAGLPAPVRLGTHGPRGGDGRRRRAPAARPAPLRSHPAAARPSSTSPTPRRLTIAGAGVCGRGEGASRTGDAR